MKKTEGRHTSKDPNRMERMRQKNRMILAYQAEVQTNPRLNSTESFERKRRYKRCHTELKERQEKKMAKLAYEREKQRIIPLIPSPEKCLIFSPCRRLRKRKRQAEMCRTPDSYVSRISNQSRRSRSPRYAPY